MTASPGRQVSSRVQGIHRSQFECRHLRLKNKFSLNHMTWGWLLGNGYLNSIWPSDPIWRLAFWTKLVDCRMFNSKALPKPINTSSSRRPTGRNFNENACLL